MSAQARSHLFRWSGAGHSVSLKKWHNAFVDQLHFLFCVWDWLAEFRVSGKTSTSELNAFQIYSLLNTGKDFVDTVYIHTDTRQDCSRWSPFWVPATSQILTRVIHPGGTNYPILISKWSCRRTVIFQFRFVRPRDVLQKLRFLQWSHIWIRMWSKILVFLSHLLFGITKPWCTIVAFDMRSSTSYADPGLKMREHLLQDWVQTMKRKYYLWQSQQPSLEKTVTFGIISWASTAFCTFDAECRVIRVKDNIKFNDFSTHGILHVGQFSRLEHKCHSD
jgi:hypothetical protein